MTTTAPQIRSQSFLGPYAEASGFNAVANGLVVGWAYPTADALKSAALLPLPSWPDELQAEPLALDEPLLIGSELFPSLSAQLSETEDPLDLDFDAIALAFDQITGEPTVALQVSDAFYRNHINQQDQPIYHPSSVLLVFSDLQAALDINQANSINQTLSDAILLRQQPISAIQYLPAQDEISPLLVQSEMPVWGPDQTNVGAVHHGYLINLDSGDPIVDSWAQDDSGYFTATSAPNAASFDPYSLSGEAVQIPFPVEGQPALFMASMASVPTDESGAANVDLNIHISAYDANGTALESETSWPIRFGNAWSNNDEFHYLASETTEFALGPELAFDSKSRQLIVAGTMRGNIGPINPSYSLDVGIGLASYDLDGNLLWQRRIGDSGFDSEGEIGIQYINDLTVADDGTVLVLGTTTTGLYGQSLKGDTQNLDAFITAFSREGLRLWTHQFGSPNNDWAESMAFMPVEDGDQLTNTLVVVGQQQTDSDSAQAWVELLEIPDLANVARSALPPAPLSLDFDTLETLLVKSGPNDSTIELPLVLLEATDDVAGGSEYRLSVGGQVDPSANLSHLEITLAPNLLFGEVQTSVSVDSITGFWNHTFSHKTSSSPEAYLSGATIYLEPIAPDDSADLQLMPDAVQQSFIFAESGAVLDLGNQDLLLLTPNPSTSGITDPDQLFVLKRSLLRDGGGVPTDEGQRLLVDYKGTLVDGSTFDSSFGPDRLPFELTLGAGSVITGWDEGLQGLPLESQVRLVIPSELAYGDKDKGGIPADSTLIFDVDLRADLTVPEIFFDAYFGQYGLNIDALNSRLGRYFASIDQYSQAYEEWKLNTDDGDDQFYLSILQFYQQQSYPDDLFALAALLGPGDGSNSDDVITVSSGFDAKSQFNNRLVNTFMVDTSRPTPLADYAWPKFNNDFLFEHDAVEALEAALPLYGRDLPRLAMGGLGNDELQSLSQTALLFGESGDDQISSIGSNFSIFDGGTGDDLFVLGSGDALVLGGPGVDELQLPFADLDSKWIVPNGQESVSIGESVYQVIQRQRISTETILQTVYMKDVEYWDDDLDQFTLISGYHKASDLLHVLLSSSLPLELTASSRVEVSSVTELLQLDIAASNASLVAWNDQALVISDKGLIEGSADELNEFLLNHVSRFSSLPESLKLQLTNTKLDASDLLQLLASGYALDASSVEILTGSEAERKQVFSDSSITISPSSRWQSVPQDGVFGVGESLEFVLAFDQPMQWSGSGDQLPSLQLSNGLTAELDLEASSMATGTLVFRHQVAAGESVEDLTIASDALLLSDQSQLTNLAGDVISAIEAFDSSVEISGVVLPTVSVSVPGRVYRPGEVIHYSLEFSEQVRWQPYSIDGSNPSLKLTDGINAQLSNGVDPSVLSTTHDFDVLIGNNPSRIDQLQVDQLLGAGHFVDQDGNALKTPSQQQLAVRNAPDVSSHHWNLDIDGDGSLSPFRDGILIMKYLINPSATPQDLVSGMLLDPASRSPQQIYDYLVLGSQEGFLDVDRSGGDPSLFTDGIILLKHLIGFQPGASLVQGLLGAESGFIPLNVETGFLLQPSTLSQADLSEIGEEVGGLLVALMG